MSKISTFTSEVICLVDGTSSGIYLAPAFLAAGYRCVHITNTFESFPGPSSVPLDYFEEDIQFDGDLHELQKRLAKYRIAHLMAGSETGVELADQLSTALGLRSSNGIELSLARRDKFVMQEALRRAGVPSPQTKTVLSGEEVIAWATASAGWPIVVKPPRSAGTDRVRICKNEEEVRGACDAIIGKKNMLGVTNTGILAQQFLEGNEFMVNSVSAQGEHRILEIWRSHKYMTGGIPLYDHLDLVCPSEHDYAVLASYTVQVLQALDIRHGPAHAEVMMKGDKPMLIECAARLQGNINPAALLRVTGSNQIIDSVASYISPHRFLARTKLLEPLNEHCKIVLLLSPLSGVLAGPLPLERIEGLASFHSLRLRQKATAGSPITQTTDLLTTVGSVYLVHDDAMQLDRDYAAIRDIEGNGFYANIL
ncbi:MAG: ATP-grasp domain-containing protein [Burkholderiaceae bacterium]|nr:ATP-grasp domain-containing protein [Burkholderiaceae bacterium]